MSGRGRRGVAVHLGKQLTVDYWIRTIRINSKMILILCDCDYPIIILYLGCDPQMPMTTTAMIPTTTPAPEIPRENYLNISDKSSCLIKFSIKLQLKYQFF